MPPTSRRLRHPRPTDRTIHPGGATCWRGRREHSSAAGPPTHYGNPQYLRPPPARRACWGLTGLVGWRRSSGRPSPARPDGPAMPFRPHRRAKSPISIVLADDHGLFRESMRLALARLSDLAVIGEGADGSEAVALTQRLRPDILLLDDDMPDVDG